MSSFELRDAVSPHNVLDHMGLCNMPARSAREPEIGEPIRASGNA